MSEFRKSVYGTQVYTAQNTQSPENNRVPDLSRYFKSKLIILALAIALVSVLILVFLIIESNPNPNYPSQEEILRVTPPNR